MLIFPQFFMDKRKEEKKKKYLQNIALSYNYNDMI